MRNQLLYLPIICLSISASAWADFHLEVSEAGENMFQIDLWADPGSEELNTSVLQVQAKTGFTDFMGLSGSDLVISELQGLNGFTALPTNVGDNLTMDRAFNVFSVLGVVLGDKDSPTNTLPVLKVSLDSASGGMYEAAVLDPDGLLDQTSVNVSTDNVLGSTSSTKLSAVPEPSSFAMIGIVAASGYGIVYLRRRLRGSK